MEDGNVYVYDFSELREEVKNIETQISELAEIQSDQAEAAQTQISELAEVQFEQVSEIVSIMSEAAESNAEIKSFMQIETILLFAIIGFIGVVCGVVGALTWRSNNG